MFRKAKRIIYGTSKPVPYGGKGRGPRAKGRGKVSAEPTIYNGRA